LQFLVSHCTSGDLVLSMSNGSFDGLPQRLLAALRERHGKG
jgi:UDP-N-acetylmuramate-alanine ligase